MTVLIVGSRGQLGRDLIDVFGEDHEVVGRDLPELDIADRDALANLVEATQPELIINAAAYTDVEAAESHRQEAFRTNETGARNVARIAGMLGVPVVYYSTDFVFDGAKASPYQPEDPPRPVSVYGESKLAGEQATREANPRHFILRTAWLYGPGGNNFVEKILRAAVSRPKLRVVHDEMGSPTYTLDLAQTTRDLCRSEAFGIYHVTNTGYCSRFDFARTFLAMAGVEVELEPCPAAEFPSKARRPAYSVLALDKTEDVVGHSLRSWPDAVSAYLERRKHGGCGPDTE